MSQQRWQFHHSPLEGPLHNFGREMKQVRTIRSKAIDSRWRNYSDLSPTEKAAVRRRYAAGESIMRIAQGFRVYAGTVMTAADRGRWGRRVAEKTVGQQIAAAILRRPKSSDSEIAEMVGCDQSYVHTVRGRIRVERGTQ
jgi:hypothetical protein